MLKSFLCAVIPTLFEIFKISNFFGCVYSENFHLSLPPEISLLSPPHPFLLEPNSISLSLAMVKKCYVLFCFTGLNVFASEFVPGGRGTSSSSPASWGSDSGTLSFATVSCLNTSTASLRKSLVHGLEKAMVTHGTVDES